MGAETEAAPVAKTAASSSSTALPAETATGPVVSRSESSTSAKANGLKRKAGKSIAQPVEGIKGAPLDAVAEASEPAVKGKSKRKRKAAATITAEGRDGASAVQSDVAEPVSDKTQAAAEALAPGPKKGAGVKAASAAARHESRRARRRRHLKNLKTKEPEVAASYLKAWDERGKAKPSDGGWKFNKATQAWLLRHAYDPARVAKSTFLLLLRYLEGLQGAARERTCAEAGAIVESRGARSTTAPEEEKEAVQDEAGKDDEEGSKKKKKKRQTSEGAKLQGEDAADAAAETEETAKDEERARKARLRRAKRVLAVLNGDAQGAADDEV